MKGSYTCVEHGTANRECGQCHRTCIAGLKAKLAMTVLLMECAEVERDAFKATVGRLRDGVLEIQKEHGGQPQAKMACRAYIEHACARLLDPAPAKPPMVPWLP